MKEPWGLSLPLAPGLWVVKDLELHTVDDEGDMRESRYEDRFFFHRFAA